MIKEISINAEARGEQQVPAYLVSPDKTGKYPALIIIHEIWGLNENIKDVTRRLSAQGYLALAPNLFWDSGIEGEVDEKLLQELANPATRDEAQKKLRAALAPIRTPEFGAKTLQNLRACFSFLQQQPNASGAVGVIGFCFGGTYSFALATHEPTLKAAVPFYGRPPEPADTIANIRCPVFAFYGELDTELVKGIPALEQKMKEYGKDFRHIVYPGTGHAFFNDTNPNVYNKPAADDAWQKTLSFLSENLK